MRILPVFLAFAAFTLFSASASVRPNIVLIMADDLGWAELGCYGQQKIRTPQLDKLAATGQRYTQFYSGSPVCSPSRNVLLTGRHTGGCDIQDLKRATSKEGPRDSQMKGDHPISDAAYTLPEALRKIGYDTAAFGKWGLGEYGTSGAPDVQGFPEFSGYTDHRVCHSFYPEFLWRNGKKIPLNDPGISGHARVKGPDVDDAAFRGTRHSSGVILNDMLSYIDSRAGKNEPFFLYYAPLEPHVALQPLQEWVEKYPRSWDPKPYLGDKWYLPHSRPHAAYAATISYMDDNVGKLLARLEERGLRENTIVIFTSDNGTTHDVGGVDHKFFKSTGELKGLKGSLDEGGIRVPGIVSWPGKIPAGKTIAQPAYSADIMPTLCAITGADPGQPLGENLSALWTGKTAALPDRRPLVWCFGGYEGQVAVRLGDMKAIRKLLDPMKHAAPGNWRVYDIARDPSEKHDLAAERRDIIGKAQAVLKAEYKPAKGYPVLNIFAPETH